MLLIYLHFALTTCILGLSMNYNIKSGFLEFTDTTPTQEVTLPHYEDPTFVYGLASINFTNYFSFSSNYTIIEHPKQDNLKMTVAIGGTNTFKILISYVYMQSMPNFQVVFFNLTSKRPSFVHTSVKHLQFDEDIYISALLLGFSSSNYTKDNYFTSSKGSYIYSFYTNLILGEYDWIAVSFVILQSNYEVNKLICIGSYTQIELEQKAQNHEPKKVEVEPGLHFLIGLEAIQARIAVFVYDREKKTIDMGYESGIFSYSTIVINNTCNKVFSKQLYEQTKEEKKYFGLMITFIVLFVVLMIGVIIWVIKKWRQRKNRIKIGVIPPEVRSDNIIISTSESSRSNGRSIEDSHQNSKNRKGQKPRMVVSALDKIQKRRNSVQNNHQQEKQRNRDKSVNRDLNKSNDAVQKNRSLRLNQEKYIETQDIDIGDAAPQTQVRLKSETNIVYCLVCSNQLGSQRDECKVCQKNKIGGEIES